MAFSDQQLQDVRERTDLVAVLGKRVQLRKAGKDYVGLCPFHGERTPSFNVIPNKHIYHCFGCGESGDVFKFFMKLDGLSFVEAVKYVATEAGIMLVEEKFDPEEAKRKQHLEEMASLLERAVGWYEKNLWAASGKIAQEHLKKRGIREDFIRKFHLGFGGAAADGLSQALAKAGVSSDLAVEAGLTIPSRRGGTFDRFQGRLIVPIRIPRPPDGRTVGMGGRFLEGVTPVRGDRKPAKYVNSPETPLYQKSHVLYGLDQARDSIRKSERAVIVEGYFDVIGVHQAGLPLAVATCGTSLTPSHLDLLMRSAAKEIIFLFDGDAAGLKASARAAEMCARAQVPARVALLPQGLDPDEFARQRGLEALQALLERAKPAVEMLIDHKLDELGKDPTVEERARVVQEVKGVVMAAPEGLNRDLYIQQIAERLSVPPATVKAALEEPPRRAIARPGQPRAAVERGPRTPVGPRRTLPTQRPEQEPKEEAAREERPGAPPPPTRSGVEQRLAEKHLKAEVTLIASLLRYPVLSSLVAQEGVLGDFENQELRTLGERVLQSQADATPPTFDSLYGGLSQETIERLRKPLADLREDSLETVSTNVTQLIDKLRQQSEERRKFWAQRGSATVPPGDEAAAKALLEKGQGGLLKNRITHLRKRERQRPPGSDPTPPKPPSE